MATGHHVHTAGCIYTYPDCDEEQGTDVAKGLTDV